MFEAAIIEALKWTRPVFSIHRFLDQTEVVPGAATLIVINEDGWILTCKHVLDELLLAGQLEARRAAYRSERAALGTKVNRASLRKLATKHGYDANPLFEFMHQLTGVVEGFTGFQYFSHPSADIALIKPQGVSKVLVGEFPRFSAETSPPPHGRFLCRIGFPFPEFTHFAYDQTTDSIGWVAGGVAETPFFPTEGMVTRHVRDATGITGFEMSTPGLRGQSGGPVVDASGVVHGMQSATFHLDLNFDVRMPVRRGHTTQTIKSTPFLHVGRAVAASALTSFMKLHNVQFST